MSEGYDENKLLGKKGIQSWDTTRRNELLKEAKKQAEKQKVSADTKKLSSLKLAAEKQKMEKEKSDKQGTATSGQKMTAESMNKDRQREQAAQKEQGGTEQPTQAV